MGARAHVADHRVVRALAARLHEECGGPGVGAVGMCFTGGFALAMMVDDAMLAPVLSQPSLPFPVGKDATPRPRPLRRRPRRVKARPREGQCVLGLRFTGDPAVPAERFQRLREELGDEFIAVEIDSSKGNPRGIPRAAHSVLTEHLVDEPGHPTGKRSTRCSRSSPSASRTEPESAKKILYAGRTRSSRSS